MAEDHHPTEQDLNAGYEKSDINVKRILGYVVGITVFLIVTFIFLNGYFIRVKEQVVYDSVLKPGSKKLQQVQEREAEQLYTYGVIDTANGVYQIPIERAMKLEADDAFEARVQDAR